VHPVTRKFYKNEVFKSDRLADYLSAEVSSKCCVLFIKDYQRGFPAGVSHKDVWCCESRYIDSGKRMEKIKNWKQSLPESVRDYEVDLVAHKQPLIMGKVDSPFAEDAASDGDDDVSVRSGDGDLDESDDDSFVDPKEPKRRKIRVGSIESEVGLT
jgi:chromatin structure-remodeling complex subunit RSC1/2